MRKTLAIAAVAATMMTAAIPAKANDFPLGPILGGVAGGFIGNQFGRGTGNTIATAVGAVGGVLLGQQLQRPIPPTHTHTHGGYIPAPVVGASRMRIRGLGRIAIPRARRCRCRRKESWQPYKATERTSIQSMLKNCVLPKSLRDYKFVLNIPMLIILAANL